jgi:hypothetical protein
MSTPTITYTTCWRCGHPATHYDYGINPYTGNDNTADYCANYACPTRLDGQGLCAEHAPSQEELRLKPAEGGAV